MDEQAKEARRAYFREWRRKNPEKVKRMQARYWAKKAEQAKRRNRPSEQKGQDAQIEN